MSVFIMLGELNCFKYNLKVGSINIKRSDETESHGKSIDKALNLRQRIENLCSATKFKLQVLRGIRIYLRFDEVKLLGNALFDSQFKYAPLTLMLCHKSLYINKKINQRYIIPWYQNAKSSS